VTDDKGANIDCDGGTNTTTDHIIASLAVGAQTQCTAAGTASIGQYTNIGTVQAHPSGEGENSFVYDSDTSYYFGANPSIQIIKKTNGEDANNPPGPYIPAGGTATFRYEVSNVGNIVLSKVGVTDSKAGITPVYKSGDTNANGKLDKPETWIYEASDTAAPGQAVTSASAHATGVHPANQSDLGTADDSDQALYFGYTLGITLAKYTNGVRAYQEPWPTVLAGTTVTWTYQVTNTSNVKFDQVEVTDDMGVAVTCPKATLDVGEGMTCSGSGVGVEQDYQNTGRAVGKFNGDSKAVTDTNHYHGIHAVRLHLPVVMR
jgi:uncharacterized repeat protein (TIGR01451 family)